MNLHDIENELAILRANIDTHLEVENELAILRANIDTHLEEDIHDDVTRIVLGNISTALCDNQVLLIELMRREARP